MMKRASGSCLHLKNNNRGKKDTVSDYVKKLSIINKKVENKTEKLYKIIGN